MMATGKYRFLYKYLEERYADTVVLTFGRIDDLLGFALPDEARTNPDWWTTPEEGRVGPRCSDAWVLARRTAKANIAAQHVVFERIRELRQSSVPATDGK
jgi:hypothetical protein